MAHENYLSNLVHSTTYGLDLALDMIEILRGALKEQELAMNWFKKSQYADNEENSKTFWNNSVKHDCCASGYLRSYEIITTRVVFNDEYHIREEIRWVEDEFGLFETF